MVLLQIDSLSSLWNNPGFWDNFIWPLLLAVVIGAFVLLKNRIFKEKLNAHKVDDLPIQQEGKIELSTFLELCQHILPYIIENHYIFKTYGPNSTSDVTEPLRTDMNLWKQAKLDYIVPNNERISDLISRNIELIPEQHRALFQKLQSHIYAFRKHVENEKFDYTEFQFPNEINNLVEESCFQGVQKEDYFLRVKQYIKDNLRDKRINKIILFGSFLFYSSAKNDIDLVIFLKNDLHTSDIRQISEQVKKVKDNFYKRFKKRLHLTVFTSNEEKQYIQFLGLNKYKVEIYG